MFRVVNKDGKGIDFQGTVEDASGHILSTFAPLKFGIGSFSLTPKPGAEYNVTIKDNNGGVFNKQLPKANAIGYHLELVDSGAAVKVVVKSIGVSSNPFILIHTRQSIIMARELLLTNGSLEVILDKVILPEGVSHITLFDSKKQPVCERLYFKQPETELALQITTDQNRYEKRNKITLGRYDIVLYAYRSLLESEQLQIKISLCSEKTSHLCVSGQAIHVYRYPNFVGVVTLQWFVKHAFSSSDHLKSRDFSVNTQTITPRSGDSSLSFLGPRSLALVST